MTTVPPNPPPEQEPEDLSRLKFTESDATPPPPRGNATAQNFFQLAWDDFDQLKQYEGPDHVHALTRLAMAQQLKRVADSLDQLLSIASVATGALAEVSEFVRDVANDKLVLSQPGYSLRVKAPGK